MEEVKNITYQHKTNDCVVCGAKFVYERQTMKYCSNACKCKAYQIRQTNNQSIKRLNKTPGIYGSRIKQKIIPAQTTKDTSSIIEQQRQTINQQKAYIEHLHKQAEVFVKHITLETNQMVKDVLAQANTLRAMLEETKKDYYAAKEEIFSLKKQLRSNRDQMIGNLGAAIISNLKK